MAISEVCAVSEVLCSVSDGAILNPAIAQCLMKIKGDTLSVRASRILVEGDTPMKHTSRILQKGDARWGGASPLYLICKKRIPTNYSPRDSPCANTWHDHCHTYTHVCVPMATCGTSA
jgi:hypothetical protein